MDEPGPDPGRGESAPGFTMVELLITVGILGVALLPMMDAYSRLWRNAKTSARIRRATMLGRDYLHRIHSQIPYRRLADGPVRERGTFEDEGPYRWERKVQPLEGSDPEFRALLIKLRVWFRSRSGAWRSLRCGDPESCERWDVIGVASKRGLPD